MHEFMENVINRLTYCYVAPTLSPFLPLREFLVVIQLFHYLDGNVLSFVGPAISHHICKLYCDDGNLI